MAEKKCRQEECEEGSNVPEWMVTFADMMTLLLCFFVLLLSFANMDIEKFRDMMGSVQNAFGVQTERPQDIHIAFSPSRFEKAGIELKSSQRKQLSMAQTIKQEITQDKDLRKQVSVNAEKGGVLFRVNGAAMFDDDSADLKPQARKIMDLVINVLNKHNYDLIVEGHTDDSKVKSKQFPSNWELSSARAAAALRYILENSKVPSTRLKAVGYADSRPLVPNDTERNRRTNRRVEFFYRPPTNDFHW